jgi:hypothetical protein
LSTPCVRCGAATDAFVCHPEAQALAAELLVAAGHAEDAEAVLTSQVRYGAGSRGSNEDPMPNVSAAGRFSRIEATFGTWTRHILEETLQELPRWRRLAGPPCRGGVRCPHGSCHAIRRVWPFSSTGTAAAWLATEVEWLRWRPEADEAFRELHDACAALARLVDRPPDKDLVGVCDCGKVLYATAGRAVIQCPERTCKLVWHVERSREILRRALDDKLFTAAEAARLAVRLDSGDRSTEQVRKLITKWAGRALLVAHGLADGEPTYRFGDVVDRLAVTARRNREGAAA